MSDATLSEFREYPKGLSVAFKSISHAACVGFFVEDFFGDVAKGRVAQIVPGRRLQSPQHRHRQLLLQFRIASNHALSSAQGAGQFALTSRTWVRRLCTG